MVVPWFFGVAERDHELQNPTSPEKIRRLGELLRLGPETRVLDLACGKGGPALLLASTFGCHVLGVEQAEEFAAAARERAAAARLDHLIEIVEADARSFPLEPATWNVVLCLGASFVWDGLPDTLAALTPAVRPGGYLAVGEPYWRQWPLPDGVNDRGFVDLPATAERFTGAGLRLIGLIASSLDDWDRYESLHWRALEEWLAAHPDDPDASEIRERHERYRDEYLRLQRALLEWGIFAAWKPR
jgi:SAM-dependent methyltransferase